MSGHEHANGRSPSGLLHITHPALKAAPRPDPAKLDFDLAATLRAVVALEAQIPADAHTASMLGTEREGNAVLIGDDGLFLTIGYLIAEADHITVAAIPGRMIEAEPVAYDYDTGFGLVRAMEPPEMAPIPLGSADSVSRNDPVIIAPHGGLDLAISGLVVSKREFAGYWEYMLDYALFTTPPHPNWNGAALLGEDGKLLGIGSLYVEDAAAENQALAGNMFVPVDFLRPIYDDLLSSGRAKAPPRPWIGVYVTEAMGRVFVSGVAPDGPADEAGLRQGDIVLALDGASVSTVAELYRKLWGAGEAGIDVRLRVLRDSDIIALTVRTASRYRDFRQSYNH